MGCLAGNNKIHTDPPKCGLKGGTPIDCDSQSYEKCDICFNLPR